MFWIFSFVTSLKTAIIFWVSDNYLHSLINASVNLTYCVHKRRVQFANCQTECNLLEIGDHRSTSLRRPIFDFLLNESEHLNQMGLTFFKQTTSLQLNDILYLCTGDIYYLLQLSGLPPSVFSPAAFVYPSLRLAKTQRRKDAKTQSRKDAKTQGRKDAKTQRRKDAKTQRR